MLSGRILDASGQPVRNALVEIWQVDNNGVYIHSGSNDRKKHDTNFQGFGRFLTGSSGEYCSARSSRCRIRAARRTFTSP